jgi:ribonuclease P protein component
MKRLKDRNTRRLIVLQGKKVGSSAVSLYFQENGIGLFRYAIYSNKRLGGAVKRNRIKRLFREILNVSKSRLQGFDLIIIPRTGITGMSAAEVRPYVVRLLLDNGILRDSL